jgi:hypothetical protein
MWNGVRNQRELLMDLRFVFVSPVIVVIVVDRFLCS